MVYQIISQKKDIAGGKGVMNIRKQTETDRNRQKQAVYTVHVQDLKVLSIYQKAVAFDHNLNH